MEICVQNTCEELYWEIAKRALTECKIAVEGALRLCRSIFRGEEKRALENRYGHLFTPYEEGNVGEKIFDRMVALSLPAYGNDFKAIEDMLDDPYHSELNAHYYFQTGRIIAEDYILPVFDWEGYWQAREWNGAKAIAMWEEYEEQKRAFFLDIAERLWNFDGFAKKYKDLLHSEEIQEYHEYCKKIFIEERIFLQPEWLLFSCETWVGKEEFLYANPCTDFFLQAHREALSLLPTCAVKCKALKELLSKRYKIKHS